MNMENSLRVIIFVQSFIILYCVQPANGCVGWCCDNAGWCSKIKPHQCYADEYLCCITCNKLRIKGREKCEWGDHGDCYKDEVTDPAQCTGKTLKKCCDHCDNVLDDEYMEAWKKKKAKEEADRKKKEKKRNHNRDKEFYDD